MNFEHLPDLYCCMHLIKYSVRVSTYFPLMMIRKGLHARSIECKTTAYVNCWRLFTCLILNVWWKGNLVLHCWGKTHLFLTWPPFLWLIRTCGNVTKEVQLGYPSHLSVMSDNSMKVHVIVKFWVPINQ